MESETSELESRELAEMPTVEMEIRSIAVEKMDLKLLKVC